MFQIFVGTLMTDSGLEDILQTAFGGVAKMLSGKKFPQNIRALRMVVEELLRGIIDDLFTKIQDGRQSLYSKKTNYSFLNICQRTKKLYYIII